MGIIDHADRHVRVVGETCARRGFRGIRLGGRAGGLGEHRGRAEYGDVRPDQEPVALVVGGYLGAIELVVEVVLGLELGDRVEIEEVLEGPHGAACGLPGIVPPLERDDQKPSAQNPRALYHHKSSTGRARVAGHR